MTDLDTKSVEAATTVPLMDDSKPDTPSIDQTRLTEGIVNDESTNDDPPAAKEPESIECAPKNSQDRENVAENIENDGGSDNAEDEVETDIEHLDDANIHVDDDVCSIKDDPSAEKDENNNADTAIELTTTSNLPTEIKQEPAASDDKDSVVIRAVDDAVEKHVDILSDGGDVYSSNALSGNANNKESPDARDYTGANFTQGSPSSDSDEHLQDSEVLDLDNSDSQIRESKPASNAIAEIENSCEPSESAPTAESSLQTESAAISTSSNEVQQEGHKETESETPKAEVAAEATEEDVNSDAEKAQSTELILDAKIQALREQYLQDALEDWMEDHPNEDPNTSEDWAEERELALADFEETLVKDETNEVSSDDKPRDTRAASTPNKSTDAFASFSSKSKEVQTDKKSVQVESTTVEDPKIQMSEWFRKTDSKGKLSKAPRFFSFSGSEIQYFAKDPSISKKRTIKARGVIVLDKFTQVATLNEGKSLVVHTAARTWRLHADESRKISTWMDAIIKVLKWLNTGEPNIGPRSTTVTNSKKKLEKAAKLEAKLVAKQQKEQSKLEKKRTTEFKGHVHGDIKQGAGIGGFTKTELQLSTAAKSALRGAKGTTNFVSLMVSKTEMSLEVDSTKSCKMSAKDIGSLLHSTEPRYYVIVSGKICTFIYCCPEDSDRKSRMVYSTAKASAIDHVASCGMKPTSKVEVTSAEDLTDEDLVPTAASVKKKRKEAEAPPPKHVQAKAAPKVVVADPKTLQGSLSAFMANELGSKNESGSGKKKKIVIVPSGAH